MTFSPHPDVMAGPSSFYSHHNSQPTASQSRERFFPPPFRIDQTDQDLEGSDGDTLVVASPSRAGLAILPSSPGNRRQAQPLDEGLPNRLLPHQPQRSSPLRPPPKKKRKLLFTSQLPPPEAENDDGTPSVAHMRYRSTMRLKLKWDEIYERFKDAHLTKQDEIYLGRGRQKMRLLKDNGVIRGFKEEMAFGSFHIKDEDLDDVARELKRAAGEDVDAEVLTEDERKRKKDGGEMILDSDEDELGVWDEAFLRSQYREFTAAPEENDDAGEPSEEEEEADPATMDPDLRAFLQEEAHRKQLMGDEEEDDEEDSIVDFTEAKWDRMRGTTTTSSEDEDDEEEEDTDGEAESDPAHPRERSTLYLSQPGQYDTSDDDLDVLDQDEGALIPHSEASAARQRRGPLFPHGDWDIEDGQGGVLATPDVYGRAMLRSRDNVEALLTGVACTPLTMPHDEVPDLVDIFGLATLDAPLRLAQHPPEAGEENNADPQTNGRSKSEKLESGNPVAGTSNRRASSESALCLSKEEEETVSNNASSTSEVGSGVEENESVQQGDTRTPSTPPSSTATAVFVKSESPQTPPLPDVPCLALVAAESPRRSGCSPTSHRLYTQQHSQQQHNSRMCSAGGGYDPAAFPTELTGASPPSREASTTLAF